MTATSSFDHDDKKKVLKSAPPPWHAITLVVGLFAIFLNRLPSLESLDEIATLETIQHVNFKTIFSVQQLGWIRILSGSIMLLDSTYALFFGAWEQDTVYWFAAPASSKLTVVQQIPFRGVFRAQPASIRSGLMTWSSFTMWAWIMEGWTFVLLGVLTLLPPDTSPQLHVQHQWLYRIALIGWEISAPTSILVSSVVKYVLWPECAENSAKYRTHNVLKHPGALLEHNWNVLAALLDIGMLGGLPVRFKDISVAPLFGLIYVVYSWSMMHSWCDPDKGPQFIYPFLDTTMGWTTSVALLALLLLLMLSYGIFAWADHVLTEYLDGSIVTHAVVVVLFAACVCRFRD
jgi:hypothetical protein